MSKTANDYLESLFAGIDTLIDKKLEGVQFDSTIICTIVDNGDSKNGVYAVTDGSITFQAYADNSKLLVGDQVRVNIPMGDFTQKKFIVGKYVANSDANPITYISPADTVVNVSGNLAEGVTGNIVANGNVKSVILWNKALDASFLAMQNNNIYNTIILSGDFRTLLSNYDLIDGSFGLKLDLLVRPSSNSSVKIRRTLELDSKEMFGNPYAFSIASPQAKIFTIDTVGIVEAMELSLYQNGDFQDKITGPIIPFAQDPNIFVDNIVLGLGCNVGNMEDNNFQIYTESDISYKYNPHNNDTNLKTIGLLWLNKNDNNQYIGFSDGVYDPNYDELTYLAESRGDTRLSAQKGRENIPHDAESLNLAANIEEAEKSIVSAADLISRDLVSTLRELRVLVQDVAPINNSLGSLLDGGGSRYLTSKVDSIRTSLDNPDGCGLKQQYSQVLKYGFGVWSEQFSDAWDSKWDHNYGKDISDTFTDIRNQVDWLLDTSEQGGFAGVNDVYSGLKSVYDTYKTRLQRLTATIDGYLGRVDANSKYADHNKYFPSGVLDNADFNTLQHYKNKNKTEYKIYQNLDLSEHNKKYCVYWYRYEKDYKAPDTEQILPDGWRRLTEMDNFGLPPVWLDEFGNPIYNNENKTLYAPKPDLEQGTFTFYMDPNCQQEKFMAVLFYDHVMYKSNELIFTNAQPIPDQTTLDKGDILIFEHGENSSDTFQSYSMTGYLLDASDESRARRIRCHHDGLLAKDNAMVNGGIYWYVPGASTMLSVDIDDLRTNRKFSIDDNKSTFAYEQVEFNSHKRYAKNKYFTKTADNRYVISADEAAVSGTKYYEKTYSTYCFYKKVTATKKPDADSYTYEWEKWDFLDPSTGYDTRDFWYHIKPYYDYNAVNNNITCVLIPEEDVDPVQGIQVFAFGFKGTAGTKYTLAITNSGVDVAASATKGLGLRAELKDFDDHPLELLMDADYTTIDGKGHNFTVEWLGKINNNANAYPELMENYNVLPSEITFNTPQGYFGFLSAKARIMLRGDGNIADGEKISAGVDPSKTRAVDLSVVYAVPYGSENYYIQGPTKIIYNSLGTLDGTAMYNTPYKLFCRKGVSINGNTYGRDEEIQNVQWTIDYYTISDKNLVALTNQTEIEFYNKYMPTLQNGNLVPSTMYISNGECYPIVTASCGGQVLWRQPIIILQNKYASSMLNDWDGSLTIDEKNGTILSTMVGAGRKTSDNTFEGVLMGDIALGTGSNLTYERGDDIGLGNHTGMGLYGFHDGEQSFGFNVDGTAFLGKSGAGRIIFNGNSGTIASANWFTGGGELSATLGIKKTSEDGMCIDLTTGHIDAYNFRLTSKNIYFNSDPTNTSNTFSGDHLNYGYFMKIGDESKGYISLSADGELVIRANSFYFTGTLGNGNLLRQTSPRKQELVPQTYTVAGAEVVENTETATGFEGTTREDVTVTGNTNDANGTVHYTWKVDAWKVASTTSSVAGTDSSDGEKNYWIEAGAGRLTQSVSLKANKDYTISGYIKTTAGQSLSFAGVDASTIVYANLDDGIDYGNYPFTIPDDNWHYFRCTFKPTSAISAIGFECGTAFKLWHAKLEEGSVATDWALAAQDVEENTEYVKNNYDYYLTQDNLFTKLFRDPKTGLMTDGIALVSGDQTLSGRQELFINATYIASGILRSKNYDGKITIKRNASGEYEYSVTKHPENGMYMDLEHGKIWAAKFELDAWSRLNPDVNGGEGGLYLNSHPGNSADANGYKYGYYLKLGRENGNFITFDANGNLKMRVNSLEITAPLGGTNLLHQTSPRETIHVPATQSYVDVTSRTENGDGTFTKNETTGTNTNAPYSGSGENRTFNYTWKLDKWTAVSGTLTGAGAIVENQPVPDKPYYLTGSTNFYQTVEDLRSTHTYTLSGWFQFAASGGTLTLNLGSPETVTFTCLDGVNKEKATSLTVNDSEWHYFYCTFEKPANKNIGFSSTASFNLWHAKLERGTVATEWSMSPTDVEENANAEVRKLDNRLLQDEIFEKLFTDPISGQMSDGIIMRPASETLTGRPELFINATYIAAGILRSKNWDGLIKATKNGNAYDYTISRHPTKGMYFDLDNGQVWAARFELNAWNTEGRGNSGNGLYLNSHPSSIDPNLNYYLKLGHTDASYITFDVDGKLTMRVNSLELTGNLGGANLLNNTAPRQRYYHETYNVSELQEDGTTKIVPKTQETAESLCGTLTDLSKPDYWTVSKGSAPHAANPDERRSILLGNNCGITQNIDYGLISGQEYIVSCRVYSSNGTVINFNLSGCSVLNTYSTSHTIDQDKWYVIRVAFKRNVMASTDATFTISTSGGSAYVHQLKLEEGTVATQWCKSEQDKLDDAEAYTNNNLSAYNTAMNQEQVFKKLTTDANGNVMKGIWLLDSTITGRKELYISATYMSTGILRSENFDGTITEDGVDNTNHTKYKVTGGTKGMYINMNTGYLWAKTFSLETSSIYLSDTAKEFEIGAAKKKINAVLRMGSGFAVTSDGTVYASNVQSVGTISGGTINGAGIIGGSISIGSATAADGSGYYKFYVDKNGNVTATNATLTGKITATSGKIGGWEISGNNLQCGQIILNGTTGTISGNTGGTTSFSVAGGTGQLTATGANLTNLTVTNTLEVTGTGIFSCDGTATLGGDTTIEGDLTMTGGITIETPSLQVGTATALGGNESYSITIDTPWNFQTAQLTFTNGILTGYNPDVGNSTIAQVLQSLLGGSNASVGNDGTPIYVSGGALTPFSKSLGALAYVNDIKKKFNVTASGKVINSSHNYYVLDSATGGSYTAQGERVGVYLEGTKAYPVKVTNYSGWVIKCSDKNDYHYVSNPNKTYYYKKGTTEYYPTYKKAGDLTVKVIGSDEVTFGPDTSAAAGSNNDVSLTVTGGTVTIS